jgi:hypothetical protein
MLVRLCISLLALAQTAFALLLVAGHSRFAGRVLVAISPTHGLDQGDVPVLAVWLVCMLCCAVLWVKTKPE